MITHDDVKTLIETEVLPEVVSSVLEESRALNLLTRLKDMSAKEMKINVEDSLPVVYWQATPTSKKKISKMSWKGVTLSAEELAVIIPVAEVDIADTKYDLVGNLKRDVRKALAKAIDETIFFGTNKPTAFPAGIVTQALAKGHTVELNSTKALYSQISDAMGLVEDDGFEVTGILGGTGLKKVFRDMRDSTGQVIVGDEISALPRAIVKNGAWDNNVAKLIVGDFQQAVYSIRQDLEVKLLTEGIIQDPNDSSILHNLAQEDKVAFRFTFRMAWALPNPVTQANPDEETRLPFAAIVPASEVQEDEEQ